MYLHEKISGIMKDQEINQVEMAYKTGITQGHISKIMNGSVTVPNIETIKKIAGALNLNHHELIKDTDYDLLETKRNSGYKVCVNPSCPGLKIVGEKTLMANLTGFLDEGGGNSKSIQGAHLVKHYYVLGEPDEKYCGYCAEKLYLNCSFCDNPIKDTQKPFCGYCGNYFFHLCEHENQEEDSIPTPILIFRNFIENVAEVGYLSQNPDLKVWNRWFDHETILVRKEINKKKVELVEPFFDESMLPDPTKEDQSFLKYEFAKFKSEEDYQEISDFYSNRFVIRVSKSEQNGNEIWERYVPAYEAICPKCGCFDFCYEYSTKEMFSVEGASFDLEFTNNLIKKLKRHYHSEIKQ